MKGSLIVVLCCLSMYSVAQDSLYILKNGIVTHTLKQSDVDSIIFYRPSSTIVTDSTVTDVDGNIYKIVTIGTQVWMAENLRTTKYNDNSGISLIPDSTAWEADSTGAFSYYNNDKSTNESLYGALYNWHAVNSAKLCPTGWRVPNDDEFTTLTNYLIANGHNGTEGAVLKATSGWNSSGNGTDNYGFKGVPGGVRNHKGPFNNKGDYGYFWTSSQVTTTDAWYRELYSSNNLVYRGNTNRKDGLSVRCLKD